MLGFLPSRKSPAFILVPSIELLFQKGADPDPVVAWNVAGTPTIPAPGEMMASAQAAAGIRTAAAIVNSVFIIPPMCAVDHRLFTVWRAVYCGPIKVSHAVFFAKTA